MFTEGALSRPPGERNRDRLSGASRTPVEQNRDPRQVGQPKWLLLDIGRNILPPIRSIGSRLASFIKPPLPVAIRTLEPTHVSLAQHSSDSRQHRPHISAAIAAQVNDPALWLLRLQIQHNSVQLLRKVLEVRAIFLPLRVPGNTHRNNHVCEDPSPAAINVPFHPLPRRKRR